MSYNYTRKTYSNQESAEMLCMQLKKRVKTTMIGSIASIEENLSFLWERGDEESEKFFELFQKIRSEILDKGNRESRNLESDLNKYEIKSKFINYNFPVKDIK